MHLNLTKISNQARRWVKGVFSSSKYISNVPKYKRNHQSQPPPIYKPSQQIESLAFSLGKTRGHETHCMEPPNAGTLRLVPWWWPRVILSTYARWSLTVTCRSPDAVKWALDASGTHQTRMKKGSQTRWITGLTPPDASWASSALSQKHLLKTVFTELMDSKHPVSGA